MFEKLPPCNKPHIGCLNCGAGEMERIDDETIIASMDTVLYNGFGGWQIQCDGKVVYEGRIDLGWHQYPKLKKYEGIARKDPDHDWRAVCMLPLRDATYQRQDVDKWVLIESGPGFA